MMRAIRDVASAFSLAALLLLLPAGAARAAVVADAAVTFPANVRVGQSFTASITMRNANTAPHDTATNFVCNFGAASPCPAGDPGITLIPSCGSPGGASGCPAGSFDPGVFRLSSTAIGQVGTTCSGTTFNVALVDTTIGIWRFTPQPAGANVALAGAGSTCRAVFNVDVLRAPAIDAAPGLPGTQTVQVTRHTQRAAATISSAFGENLTTVDRALSTITTTASSGGQIGIQVTDTATISNAVNPDGGVTFRLYSDAACTNQVFSSSVPIAGGAATSSPFTPTAAGTYRWIATYSGDANNNAAIGFCNDPNESVTILAASPSIRTTASAGGPVGTVVNDTATLLGGLNPTGTVTFRLYSDAACSIQVFTSTNAVASGGATSGTFTPATTGIFRWIASYSGDANNNAVSATCNAPNESVTIGVPSTLTTVASPGIEIGGQVSDTATLAGGSNPAGTISFSLFGPNDANCGGAPVLTSTVGVAGNGAYTSALFTPSAPGTYRWIASYSGDAVNAPVTAACNAANESVVVSLADLIFAHGFEAP